MDRRERIGESVETLALAMEGALRETWTALPGIIETYNPAQMTVTVRPATLVPVRTAPPPAEPEWLEISTLVDVPVCFPGGGGSTLTFPIKKGDECLVVFASRCIDGWWDAGGLRRVPDQRSHDLSDGFAFVGVRSRPRAFAAPTDRTELRRDDGAASIRLYDNDNIQLNTTGTVSVVAGGNVTASAGGSVTISSTGNATITAPLTTMDGSVTVTGNLRVNGNIFIDGGTTMQGAAVALDGISINGIPFGSHRHNENGDGGGITSGPRT